MGRINRVNGPEPGLEQRTADFAESIAAIAHGEEIESVPRPRPTPAPGQSLRGSLGSEGAFEFIGNDQDTQRHGGV